MPLKKPKEILLPKLNICDSLPLPALHLQLIVPFKKSSKGEKPKDQRIFKYFPVEAYFIAQDPKQLHSQVLHNIFLQNLASFLTEQKLMQNFLEKTQIWATML